MLSTPISQYCRISGLFEIVVLFHLLFRKKSAVYSCLGCLFLREVDITSWCLIICFASVLWTYSIPFCFHVYSTCPACLLLIHHTWSDHQRCIFLFFCFHSLFLFFEFASDQIFFFFFLCFAYSFVSLFNALSITAWVIRLSLVCNFELFPVAPAVTSNNVIPSSGPHGFSFSEVWVSATATYLDFVTMLLVANLS